MANIFQFYIIIHRTPIYYLVAIFAGLAPRLQRPKKESAPRVISVWRRPLGQQGGLGDAVILPPTPPPPDGMVVDMVPTVAEVISPGLRKTISYFIVMKRHIYFDSLIVF